MKSLALALGCLVLFGLSLSGCASASRFEFGGYDTALYAYSKHPDRLAAFETALQNAIDKGRATNHLAPGLQAELGYCYLAEGKRPQAIVLFKAEMSDFPESRSFLSKIIDQNAG